MPTYKYTGSKPFVDNIFNIRVAPGDIILTEYFLPDSWKNFVLLDATTPPPVLPHTEEIVVDSMKEIKLGKFNSVVIVLKNPESSSVAIKCRHPNAPTIILDGTVSYWRGNKDSKYDYLSTLYVEPVSGTPVITVYYGFIETEYGMFSVTITGGGGGGTDTIGVPSDGTYDDGLLDFEPTTKISDAIDDINELLKYIAPEPPKPLAGNLILSTSVVTGYLANYTNLGTLTAGTQHNLIVGTDTFTGTTQNSERFSDADKGSLILYRNGSQVDSFDLETHFNEAEREGCQSYTPANSPGGKITVLSVCWYNNFPAYQKGQARVNFDNSLIIPGYNSIQLRHQIDTDIRQTNEMKIYYDDGPRPSVSNFNMTLNTPQYKYLSGIKYYGRNTTWDVSISVDDVFNKTYVLNPVTLEGSGINTTNIAWNDSHVSGPSDPPNYNDPWNYTNTISFNRDDAGTTISFTVTPRDPFGAGTASNRTYANYLYNTYTVMSTEKHEYFVDEEYRLPPGDYDTLPASLTGNWDSTAALTNGNAQVFVDRLVYPQINFNSGYNPAQDPGRDYSSFSGPQVYYRAIRDGGHAHSSGTLYIRGMTTSDVGSKVKFELKLPGQTGWLDMTKDFLAGSFSGADGDGIRTGMSQSGDWVAISWTVGTYSTAYTDYTYILRVTLLDSTIEILELYDFGG